MYKIHGLLAPPTNNVFHQPTIFTNSFEQWHNRLEHHSFSTIKSTLKRKGDFNCLVVSMTHLGACKPYQLAKSYKLHFLYYPERGC